MNWPSVGAVGLLLCVAAGPGAARAEDAPSLKDALAKAGVGLTLVYDGDFAANLAGGETLGGTHDGALHVQLTMDGGRAAGAAGLTGYLDGLWIEGGQPSRLVGDAQGVSNIEAPPAVRLYEAWLQYNGPRDRVSVLAGRYDLNTEFYNLRSAGLFLNSSFGIGADFGLSGFAGPSVYADTALAVRFAYKPTPNAGIRIAIVDGAPVNPVPGSSGPFDPHNGLVVVAEADLASYGSGDEKALSHRARLGRNASLPPYADKIAVGVWDYTAAFPELAPGPLPGGTPPRRGPEQGAYFLWDHPLFQSSRDATRRVTGFVQVDVADPVANRFGVYFGAGLTGVGLSKARPNDEIGLGVAMARNGSPYEESQHVAGLPVSAAETAIEASYLAQVTSWLALQPDVQYVIHPNTEPRLGDAVVVQLQFEVQY